MSSDMMESVLRSLGRKAGEAYKKSRWLYDSVAGSEEDAMASEYKFGGVMAKDILQECKAMESEYIEKLFKSVSGWINTDHRFTCTVIRGDEVNAFVLPGGYVFLTDTIVDYCEGNKDELAFIMAHEMGHVVKGHAFNRMIATHSISGIGKMLRNGGMLQQAARQLALKFLKTQYSRDNEFEADDYGIRLTKVAGYDPEGALRMFRRLKGLGEPDVPEFFSTHPSFDSRITHLKEVISR